MLVIAASVPVGKAGAVTALCASEELRRLSENGMDEARGEDGLVCQSGGASQELERTSSSTVIVLRMERISAGRVSALFPM